MSDCIECQAAQVRPNHVYVDGCVTCEVRAVSEAPKEIREAFYAKLPAEEREPFRLAVSLEYRRRKGFQP
jgi:hypothetical protein